MSAKLTGSAPILFVKDVAVSANYYRDKLGFTYDQFWGDPPGFCILERDNYHIMLARAKGETHIVPHNALLDGMWDIYFWVDDSPALCADTNERGAIIQTELHDTGYGCREFVVEDIDGYWIAFGQHIQ